MPDEFALREGEHVLRRQPASADGKSIWGGTLVLTNQRLIFQPLDLGAATAVLGGGAGHLGPQGMSVSTDDIRKVEASRDPGLFHPASLVLTLRDRSRVVIGVGAGRFTPNFSRKNAVARDEMVDLINAQLGVHGRHRVEYVLNDRRSGGDGLGYWSCSCGASGGDFASPEEVREDAERHFL